MEFYGNEDFVIEVDADTWLWLTARSQETLDEVGIRLRGTDVLWEIPFEWGD